MAILFVNDSYYAVIDSESSNTSSFTQTTSSSTVTFLIKQDQIIAFINDVLGSARLKNNSYVTRTIPASHPIFPWQYAYKIESIKGYTVNGKEDSSVLQAETTYKKIQTETPPYVGSYQYYKVTVLFTTRDYAIYTDEQLVPHYQKDVQYSLPVSDINGKWSDQFDTYTNRFEHARYTSYDYKPNIELLNFGGGNYWCKKGEPLPVVNGQVQDQDREFPVSSENSGNVNLKVCKATIDFNWFFVPFELCINNQIWQDAYSKINSDDFVYFPKGSLLFEKAEVRKYEPYYPFLNVDLSNTSSVYDYFTEYNKNQYADVTFKFISFTQSNAILIPPSKDTYQPLLCKDTNSLHNRIMGPATKFWYYVESAPAIPVFNQANEQTGWRPNKTGTCVYWSYPYSNLLNYVEGP